MTDQLLIPPPVKGTPKSRGMPPGNWRWTEVRQTAAVMVAEGKLQTGEIARKLGVPESTVLSWRATPIFQEGVRDILAQRRAEAEAARQEVMRVGIADRINRIKALDDRWQRCQQVIDERARDMADEAPGANTGLLVKTAKSIGSGQNARLVYEYAVDVALLREMRELEKQAAIELGQWTERVAIDITARIREEAERMGVDPELALAAANEIVMTGKKLNQLAAGE